MSGADGSQKRKRTESGGSDAGLPSWIVGASPPRFVSLEELMSTAQGLDNMALAHEIAVNTEFKLESPKPAAGSLEATVSEAVHEVFWEKLTEDLNQTPPVYENALTLVTELKQNLKSLLLPHHTRLRTEIEEKLDVDLFRQQCEHHCLDFLPIATYILAVMGKLCAPVRDQKITQLKELKELIPLFRGIFELLDLMKLDMANFTIASYRPVIQQHSVEYERQKFQQYLDANPDGLRHTQSWLRRAVNTWKAENSNMSNPNPPQPKIIHANSTLPSESSIESLAAGTSTSTSDAGDPLICPPSPPTITPASKSTIMTVAYWELLEWSDNRAFPETLLVDQARLYDMRNKCFQLILTTSVVMVGSSMAGRPLGETAAFKDNLKTRVLLLLQDCEQRNLQDRLPNVAEEVLKASGGLEDTDTATAVSSTSSNSAGNIWNAKKRDALRTQIIDLSQFSHPVRKLIRDRVRNFVRIAVTSPSASPVKLPPGLGIIQSELSKLTGSFLRLVSHNRQVFANHYDRILELLLAAPPSNPFSAGLTSTFPATSNQPDSVSEESKADTSPEDEQKTPTTEAEIAKSCDIRMIAEIKDMKDNSEENQKTNDEQESTTKRDIDQDMAISSSGKVEDDTKME